MSIRIVIAGHKLSVKFLQVTLVSDHLSKSLPQFEYDRIVVPVSEWKSWLSKVNLKNQWHHTACPLVWKENLVEGGKPFYIGSSAEFWEYCHSYYDLDVFMSEKVFADLENGVQLERKLVAVNPSCYDEDYDDGDNYIVCISGATHRCTPFLISGLFELSEASEGKKISTIYLFDKMADELARLEEEFKYVESFSPGKVVKVVNKLGLALIKSDLLIVLDHAQSLHRYEDMTPVQLEAWIACNITEMVELSYYIRASSTPKLRIVFANLGPSCLNATILNLLVPDIVPGQMVVSTTDLGLEILQPLSEIAEIPQNTIFCPPVWGFVGIQHHIDVRTTYHKYYSYFPYERHHKVEKTTLKSGALTPELRSLEYLMHWDDTLWNKVEERRSKLLVHNCMLTTQSVLGTVKLWMFDKNVTDVVTCLGVVCDGSFDLKFDGFFSQPAHLVDNLWKPAAGCYPMPRDSNANLRLKERTALFLINKCSERIPSLQLRTAGVCRNCGCKKDLSKTCAICECRDIDEEFPCVECTVGLNFPFAGHEATAQKDYGEMEGESYQKTEAETYHEETGSKDLKEWSQYETGSTDVSDVPKYVSRVNSGDISYLTPLDSFPDFFCQPGDEPLTYYPETRDGPTITCPHRP